MPGFSGLRRVERAVAHLRPASRGPRVSSPGILGLRSARASRGGSSIRGAWSARSVSCPRSSCRSLHDAASLSGADLAQERQRAGPLLPDQVWDNRRWRAMVQALFGKPAIFAISPEADFFKFHSGSGIAASLAGEDRPALLVGDSPGESHPPLLPLRTLRDRLPHFAREANYETIRANLDAVVTHEGLVETAFPCVRHDSTPSTCPTSSSTRRPARSRIWQTRWRPARIRARVSATGTSWCRGVV